MGLDANDLENDLEVHGQTDNPLRNRVLIGRDSEGGRAPMALQWSGVDVAGY